MSNLFNHIRAEMQQSLDATIKNKSTIERLHNTMAAACGLNNDCDSKTIIAEAESMMQMCNWIKPICYEYVSILNNTLDKYEFNIISSLLKELEKMEKNAWLGIFDNAFNNPQPFQISPINNPDALNQVFENTDVEHVHTEHKPVFTDNISAKTIEEEPKEEPKEEAKPKKYNWEDIVKIDYLGREYIWVTWEKDIPKNKYRVYRNGVIINALTEKSISINDKTQMFSFTSTMCTLGDRTSAINKFKSKSYWSFIRKVNKMYPGFLDREIVNSANDKQLLANKNNGTRKEDKIELTSLFQTTLYPIPEGGHYRQIDGRKFGLNGCYAINKYGHIVDRVSKVVTNAIERKGVKYIIIEEKEFEFNQLMLGAVRIDDPKVKEIEQEFLMRDIMIPVTWIEDIPAEKYIYIKGQGVYNTIHKVFLKRTLVNGYECFTFTPSVNEQHMKKGSKKGGPKKAALKKVIIRCEDFEREANIRLKNGNNDNNNDMT